MIKASLPLALALTCTVAGPALALGPDSYIGTVGLVAESACPAGTLEAAGQMMSIAQMANLYAVLGSRYGGDGMTTFGLPDLRGKAPDQRMRYCIVITGNFPRAD